MDILKKALAVILIVFNCGILNAALSIVPGTTTKVHVTGGNVDLTFPANTPTAGSVLACALTEFSGSPSVTTTDNQTGNFYAYTTGWNNTSSNDSRIVYSSNVAVSGTFTIHFTGVPGSSGFCAFCAELTGYNLTTPNPDAGTFATGTSGSGTDNLTGAAITNSNVNSIIFSALADAAGASATVNAGTNYTLDTTNSRETDGSQYEVGGLEWRIVTTSPHTPTWTINSSTVFSEETAVFQQAAGGGVIVIPQPHTQKLMTW